MKSVGTGSRYTHIVTPPPSDSAAAYGNTGVNVVSTPALIGHLEQACHLLLAPAYEADERTVGTRVAVDHKAPAQVGEEVELTATLRAQEGPRYTFEVEVRQDGRLIMAGEHGRHLIRASQFAAPGEETTQARPASAEPLIFWFDFHSPWCYLAAERIGDLARRQGRELIWRPVHLANLNQRINGRRPLEENPAFVAWYKQDLQDWAAAAGLTVTYHPDYPLRPSRALRLALYAQEEGRAEAFVRAVMRAYWQDSLDISDLTVLEGLAAEAGLSPEIAVRMTGEARYKEALNANLSAAADAGIFGLPSVMADGKIFFGNDRLEMLEGWLGSNRI